MQRSLARYITQALRAAHSTAAAALALHTRVAKWLGYAGAIPFLALSPPIASLLRAEAERYLWSVTPCLMAWPTIVMPTGPGSFILASIIGIVYMVDNSFAAKGLLPAGAVSDLWLGSGSVSSSLCGFCQRMPLAWCTLRIWRPSMGTNQTWSLSPTGGALTCSGGLTHKKPSAFFWRGLLSMGTPLPLQ
ncbi:hypothetical protein WJX72_011195 [[Myrmecia] bisecta]|uniref:Uncharacterized protein n=1 Tax=[Myrmecia] bisecta TaxID=41462 RepID=A0AAW1QSY1_9CHLO